MLAELKKGDDVVTQGGIIGKVSGIKDNELTLQLQEGVRVRVLRSAVTGLYTGATAPAGEVRDEVRGEGLLIGPGGVQHAHGKRLVVEGSTLRCRHRAGCALPRSDGGSRGEAAGVHQDALPEEDPAGAGPSGRPAPRLRGQRRQGGLGQGRPPVVGRSRTACARTRASPTSTVVRARDGATTSSSRSRTRPTRRSSTTQLLREYRKSLDLVEPRRRDRRRAAAPRPRIRSTRSATTRSARASRPSATASTSWASRSRPSSRRGPTSSSSSPASSPPTSSGSRSSSAAPRSSSSRLSTTARST